MSEEDERTLWCGNLSEKVSEELLYELFVQAGPVQLVKIPRDNEKRQRSYAFITYGHAASVEYAIDIFEGTKLFQRPLTLHKKSKNGPNPAASPKVNFNSNQRGQQQQQQQHHQNQNQNQQQQYLNSPGMREELLSQLNLGSDMMNPALVGQMMANMQELLLAQMNQPNQQQNHQGKMNHRNNRSHHQQQPYSRGDNKRGGGGGGGGGGDGQQLYSRDRNDGPLYSRDRGGRNRNGGGGGGSGNQNRRNDYRGRR